MNKFWRQPISENVGMGHPDKVADNLAYLVNYYAKTSACEIIINRNGAYFSGEVEFDYGKEGEAKRMIRTYLKDLCEDYKKDYKKDYGYNTFNFVTQDPMLAERKEKMVAGDMEVSYRTKLKKHHIHYHLKKWDRVISRVITDTCDYKILVNMRNKTAIISIGTGHIKYKQVLKYLLQRLTDLDADIKVNVVEYPGGSIWNDTGVTGRKIIADGDGCGFPHGGGAIFGKDLTKTAPAGRNYLRVKNKSGVLVYFPGDKLDEPNYVGRIKWCNWKR